MNLKTRLDRYSESIRSSEVRKLDRDDQENVNTGIPKGREAFSSYLFVLGPKHPILASERPGPENCPSP